MDAFPFYLLTDDELYFECTAIENYREVGVDGMRYIAWNNLWWPCESDAIDSLYEDYVTSKMTYTSSSSGPSHSIKETLR